jgi:hypothetical protein
MVLILHVSIAVISILLASYTLISPSMNKINFSYGTVMGTLVTGTYLVISSGSALLSACITGIIYTSIVTLAIHLAKIRLHSRSSKK